MWKSDQINELAAALVSAQSVMEPAEKNKANPFFKSKYSDLAAVWSACKDALFSSGLSVSQMVQQDDHGSVLQTVLMHKSGQWLCSHMRIKPVKDDPQSLLSAITYARRSSIASICNVVVDDDDDGNAAANRTQHKQERVVVMDNNHPLIAKLAGFLSSEKIATDVKQKLSDKLDQGIDEATAKMWIKRLEELSK